MASGDNEQMDIRRLAVSAALGLLSLVELAARLSGGSSGRAAPAGPVTHAGVSPSVALLMCALCLLATVPAMLPRPFAAAMAVGIGAVLSLIFFELLTAAGAVALVLVAYRLAGAGSKMLAVALAAPFLGLAVGHAASVVVATPVPGLAGASAETQALAVALASAIP